MKICYYGGASWGAQSQQLGAIVGDKVYSLGDFLANRAYIPRNFTLNDVVQQFAYYPATVEAAKQFLKVPADQVPKLPMWEGGPGLDALPLDKTRLRAPTTNPPTFWAVDKIYGGKDERTRSPESVNAHLWNSVFLKPNSSIIGPGDAIVVPKDAKVDYGFGLCLVIGKGGTNISENEALNHVLGYQTCWDIGTRGGGSGGLRRGFDTYSPLGPWVVTRDEIPDPQSLSMKVWLNDKLDIDGSTGNMIAPAKKIISYISQAATLHVGDLIATYGSGSHAIGDGDQLRGEIGGIGSMDLKAKISSSATFLWHNFTGE